MHKQPRLTKKKFSFTLGILALVMAAPLLMGNLTSLPLVTNQAQAAKIIKRVKVGPTDTLWSLARQHRENTDLTIQQAMLAIKDANPKAFPSNNINEMEPTATLAIPSALAMSKRTALEADRQVRRENQLWVARLKPTKVKPVTKRPVNKPKTPQPVKAKPSVPIKQQQLKTTDTSKLTAKLDSATNKISELEKVVALKDRQLDEMEQQLSQLSKSKPTSAQPHLVITSAPAIEDTSLTARMNREPLLYSGYAAAIFFSLMFFLAWLLARGKVKQLQKKNQQTSRAAAQTQLDESLTNLDNLDGLDGLESLDSFGELSASDELALQASLDKELTQPSTTAPIAEAPLVKPTPVVEPTALVETPVTEPAVMAEPEIDAELSLATETELNIDDIELDLEELDLGDLDLDELDLDLGSPELEVDISSNQHSEEIATPVEPELTETKVDVPQEAAAISAEPEIKKMALDELVETDLGEATNLEDFEQLASLEDLDLSDFDDLEELVISPSEPVSDDFANLEAPLATDELVTDSLAATDFEEVKYDASADEFLDALDSLDDELDSLEADLENLTLDANELDSNDSVGNAEATEYLENQDEANEVDTLADNHISQLDLAAAYIEMGDQAGAKEILDDLIKQASPEIQIKAQQLLETLA